MKVQGNDILGSKLVGEIRSSILMPDMELVKEVEVLMTKYQVDWMWFGWSKFGGEQGKE